MPYAADHRWEARPRGAYDAHIKTLPARRSHNSRRKKRVQARERCTQHEIRQQIVGLMQRRFKDHLIRACNLKDAAGQLFKRLRNVTQNAIRQALRSLIKDKRVRECDEGYRLVNVTSS